MHLLWTFGSRAFHSGLWFVNHVPTGQCRLDTPARSWSYGKYVDDPRSLALDLALRAIDFVCSSSFPFRACCNFLSSQSDEIDDTDARQIRKRTEKILRASQIIIDSASCEMISIPEISFLVLNQHFV